jgi:hypothetical protein
MDIETKSAIKYLTDWLQKLERLIKECCTPGGCKCECMQQPYRIVTEDTLWATATNGEGQCYYVQNSDEQMHINDRFPETTCDGQKGDLLCSDGILHCRYVIGSNGNPTGWVSDRGYYIPYPSCS